MRLKSQRAGGSNKSRRANCSRRADEAGKSRGSGLLLLKCNQLTFGLAVGCCCRWAGAAEGIVWAAGRVDTGGKLWGWLGEGHDQESEHYDDVFHFLEGKKGGSVGFQ